MIAIASDLDNAWNDFPLHASFVPFIHEVVRYLGSARPRRGEYLVGDVPAGVPAVPGFASVTRRGSGPARVAVNVDPAESAAERLTPAEFEAPVTRVKREWTPIRPPAACSSRKTASTSGSTCWA